MRGLRVRARVVAIASDGSRTAHEVQLVAFLLGGWIGLCGCGLAVRFWARSTRTLSYDGHAITMGGMQIWPAVDDTLAEAA